MENKLSHLDASGNARMVDVGEKDVVSRTATASGEIIFPEDVLDTLRKQDFLSAKGSIIQTAVIAGIQGVKKTADLIPLCHSLALSKVKIDISQSKQGLTIVCEVKCMGQTGVEMEALTGVSVAALTVYDMCKALSQEIRITSIQLDEKKGGKKDFTRSK
jgi:cyclic pyranopterin phosphate synthase